MCFLAQEPYEAVAPMEVAPRPEFATSIPMVAWGPDGEEVQHRQWAEASLRASQQVEIWKGIVGIPWRGY